MHLVSGVCDAFEGLALNYTTVNLRLKGIDEKITIAFELAKHVQQLHAHGIIHGNIRFDSIRQNEQGFYFANRLFAPSNDPQGDMYALGIVFGLAVGNFKENDFSISAFRNAVNQLGQRAASIFAEDPLLQKEALGQLSLWMIHSDPNKRPKDMEHVCQILDVHVSQLVPLAYPRFVDVMPRDTADPKLTHDIENVLSHIAELKQHAAMVAQLFSYSTCSYIPRKSLGGNFKILCSPKQNLAVFLPKKKNRGGRFKTTRKARILFIQDGLVILERCNALTSTKKGSRVRNLYRESYPKEMSLYKTTEHLKLFPKHYVSFGCASKSYKRIGIYEYIPHTFSNWIKSHNSPGTLACIAKKVLQAVSSLHAAGYVHRDLKPSNLLVKDDGTLLLCDTDTVVFDATWKKVNDEVTTYLYRPPERALSSCTGSWLAVDAFSVGCILYQLSFQNPIPWDVEDEPMEPLKIKTLALFKQKQVASRFQAITIQLLDSNAQTRLTCKTALSLFPIEKHVHVHTSCLPQ